MTLSRNLSLLVAIALMLISTGRAYAGDAKDKAKPSKLTIAVLDFESSEPGRDKIGKEIPDALGALLADDDDFEFVERAQVNKALTEQAIGLSGLVDTDKAIKIGKIVGAQILITGKVFTADGETYLTAKLIGSESSVVQPVMVKDSSDKAISSLVADLAKKIDKKLKATGRELVADEGEKDPLPELKEKLAHLKKPVVSVSVSEHHQTRQTIDPAAESEIKKILVECGFDVSEDDTKGARPTATITGEGFTEFGALLGNVTTCSARLEIKVVDVGTGKLKFADNTTSRGADLSEAIAAKTALQKAARQLTIKMLRDWVNTLPKDK